MSPRSFMLGALTAAAVAAPAALAAQKPDSGAFFVRLGSDTLGVERYVRDSHQLIAEAVLRTPQTRRMKLTITFNDKGDVAWYEVLNEPVPGVPNSVPVIRNVVTYVGDSARVETWLAAVPRATRSLPVKPYMLPLQPPFYSTYEAALDRAHFNGADSTVVSMLAASGPYTYTVRRLRGDSLSLYTPLAGRTLVRLDRNGHMTSFDAAGTTFKVFVTRARWVNLDAFARRFAAIDAAGKSVGALSPRDTVDVEVGAAEVMIDYGRPSKRGRIVFGGLVPWGEVWRTGENAATQIELSAPVKINGVSVAAGKYTLWSVPDPKRWQLILNKQTGQWGTEHDPKQDVVRIPVNAQTLTVPVERFTITVKPRTKKEGLLTLSWDRTRLVIPITAK